VREREREIGGQTREISIDKHGDLRLEKIPGFNDIL
jgi:hypothetical protein